MMSDPTNLAFRLNSYDPDFPTFDYDDIIDCAEDVPELEALHRWAMVLHNQYPWKRTQTELVPVGTLADDDYVVLLYPRNQEVHSFLRRRPRPELRGKPGGSADPAVPVGQRAHRVLHHAAHRGAGRRPWRPALHQRGPDP